MTPEFILKASIGHEPHCSNRPTKVSDIDDVQYAAEYAEPGYAQPKKGILLANWNYFSRKVTDLLERYGYSIEWSDEWTTCDDCYRIVRTSPNSYSWKRSHWFDEENCETICERCVKDNHIEEYLEAMENHPRSAITLDIDPAEYGYQLVQADLESGWDPGQNDDPQKIYQELKAKGHKHILFVLDSTGQFDINFSVWSKPEASLTDES